MDSAAQHLAPLLEQLVNYERLRPDRRLWDLATMRRLLSRPGFPAKRAPAVQVGGSKGKGTTCAFLEALCVAAHRRPGLYTSPHLITLLERIRCDGRTIPLAELERILARILAEPAPAASSPDRRPTFFEAMTVAAAEWFAEQQVDLAIYEVGLGGRFDATTALPVEASIIATIELEHTDVLGDTIAAIAGEKAAIVRPGGIAFTSATGEALAVIRAHAVHCGARLLALGEDFACSTPIFAGNECGFRLRLPDGSDHDVRLPDAAAFEVPALALAAAAFTHLMPGVPLSLDPAPRPVAMARFERFVEPDGQVLVIDGAHTEQSLAAVAREVARRWPGRKVAVLFASAAGKRWREGLSGLLPVADSVVVTGLVGTPGEDPAVIASWLAERGITSETTADAAAGLSALRRRPGPRLVAGSFYLAGQVRELVTQVSSRTDAR